MIEEKTLMSTGYLEKQNLNGSYRGMRYRLRKQVGEEGPCLSVVIWPQPRCFDLAEEESKTEQRFPFSQEGIRQAAVWLNQEYEAHREIWDQARL